MIILRPFLLVFCLLLSPALSLALEPEEVAVVANRFVEGSVDLARYYMEKRGIPKENLIRIRTTDKEFCSRAMYEKEIAAPVREFLNHRRDGATIRALVTMQGVPLRVNPPPLSKEGQAQLKKLKGERDGLQERLKKIADPKNAEAVGVKGEIAALERRMKALDKKDYRAAVDSELALVLAEDYPLDGWVLNPFFLGVKNQKGPVAKDEVLFVSRLDGPTEAIVKRIIDDSLATEAEGLKGTAYFDARWKRPEKNPDSGYAFYDNSIHRAAARVTAAQRLPVVVDDKQTLFQPGQAPGAALYCGWYSLSRYVDAFDWQRGAVGYHIASGECGTLRSGSSQAWCKRMLEDGVAATLGPVGEPYVQAFPPPEIFFSLLLDGSYTLVETYFLSLPLLSWQMVLVGDPLYRPFSQSHKRFQSPVEK